VTLPVARGRLGGNGVVRLLAYYCVLLVWFHVVPIFLLFAIVEGHRSVAAPLPEPPMQLSDVGSVGRPSGRRYHVVS